jgi:hypothetical protein
LAIVKLIRIRTNNNIALLYFSIISDAAIDVGALMPFRPNLLPDANNNQAEGYQCGKQCEYSDVDICDPEITIVGLWPALCFVFWNRITIGGHRLKIAKENLEMCPRSWVIGLAGACSILGRAPLISVLVLP